MAFDIKGFRTHDYKPNPSGAAGANLGIHSYVTNDDRAAIETANYFNPLTNRVKKGDEIRCTLTLSGTPVLRVYIVTANTGGAVTIAAQNVAA